MTRGRRCSLRRTASRWKVEWAALEDAVVVFSKDVKCIPVCDVGASRDEALGSQGSAFASFTLRLCPASDHTLIHPRPPRLANQISFVRATGFGLETYLCARSAEVNRLLSAVCRVLLLSRIASVREPAGFRCSIAAYREASILFEAFGQGCPCCSKTARQFAEHARGL